MTSLLITRNALLLSPAHGTHFYHNSPAHHYPMVCGGFSFDRLPMLVCKAHSASHVEFEDVLFELEEWVSCPQCRAHYQAAFAAAAPLPTRSSEAALPLPLIPG